MALSKTMRRALALGVGLAMTVSVASASAKTCTNPKLTLSLQLMISNNGDQFFYVFKDKNNSPSPYIDQWGNLDFSKSPGSVDVTITIKDTTGKRDFDQAYPLYYAEGLSSSDALNPVRSHHHQIQNISFPAAGVVEFCYLNDNTGGHAGGNNPYGRYAIALVDTVDQLAAPFQIDPGISNGGSSGGPGPK